MECGSFEFCSGVVGNYSRLRVLSMARYLYDCNVRCARLFVSSTSMCTNLHVIGEASLNTKISVRAKTKRRNAFSNSSQSSWDLGLPPPTIIINGLVTNKNQCTANNHNSIEELNHFTQSNCERGRICV
eukprot:scaffold19737_cov41-Attheya_sp.AAC.5